MVFDPSFLNLSTYKPLGNYKEFAELLGADIVKGILYTSDFTRFCELVLGLDCINLVGDEEYTDKMQYLKEFIPENLSITHMKSLYENPVELLELISNLSEESRVIQYIVRLQSGHHIQTEFNNMFNAIDSMTSTIDKLKTAVPFTNDVYNNLSTCLTKFIANSELLIKKIKYLPEISMDIMPNKETLSALHMAKLNTYISNYHGESIPYVLVLTSILNALNSMFPKQSLDPMDTDQFKALCVCLKVPKSIYKMAKKDEIFTNKLVTWVQSCYPNYFKEAISEYLLIRDKYNYQTQLIIDKNLGLNMVDPGLVSSCSSAIMKELING